MTGPRRGRLTAPVVAVLLATGCSQGARDSGAAEITDHAAGSTGQPQLRPPDMYPEQLPPPPGAVVESTRVQEQALLSQDLRTEHGTILRVTLEYRYGRGTPSEVGDVLDYYRAVLPTQGWTITTEEPPTPDEHPHQNRPGPHLRVNGHGRYNLTITVEPGQVATRVQVNVTELTHVRNPTQHPPLLTLPDWYQQLPEPPPGLRRYHIRVTATRGKASTYYLEYQPYPNHDDPDTAADLDAAALAQHYLQALPKAGWAVGAKRQQTERPGRYGGVIERQRVKVHFNGHGISGEVHTSQSTSAAGQWLGSRVVITIPAGPELMGGDGYGR